MSFIVFTYYYVLMLVSTYYRPTPKTVRQELFYLLWTYSENGAPARGWHTVFGEVYNR